jgi:hypothetical protein
MCIKAIHTNSNLLYNKISLPEKWHITFSYFAMVLPSFFFFLGRILGFGEEYSQYF